MFSEVASLGTWMRFVFFRNRRWVSFLIMKEFVQAKVPPEAVSSRWNSSFEAVKYHAEHVHLYREFLLAEKSSSQAVRNLLSQLETEEKVAALLPRFLHYYLFIYNETLCRTLY
jgi:hypothetical protein